MDFYCILALGPDRIMYVFEEEGEGSKVGRAKRVISFMASRLRPERTRAHASRFGVKLVRGVFICGLGGRM